MCTIFMFKLQTEFDSYLHMYYYINEIVTLSANSVCLIWVNSKRIKLNRFFHHFNDNIVIIILRYAFHRV